MEMDQYGGNNGSGYHGTIGFEDVAAEESLPHAAVRLPPINGSSSHGEEALEEGELSSPSSGTVRRMAYSSKENLIKGLDKERRVSFLRMEHEEQSTVAPMRTRKSDMTIKRNLGSAEKRKHIPSLFFDDKERRIDYVMVYKEDEEDQDRFLKAEKRRVFQENLTTRGLHLEVEDKQYSSDGKLFFVKVHIPWEVLTEYAEVLNIKMPIKKVSEEENPRRQKVWGLLTRPFDYNHAFIPSEPEYFTAGFQRNYEDQFIIKNRDEFFTPAQRSYVVFEILRRASYKQDERQKIHRERDHGEHIPSPSKVSQEESADHHREKVPKFGITRLLNQEVYDAVYPLHDGNLLKSDAPPDGTSNRQLLYSEWARFSNWFKKQPLWLVRRYFGDQLGLYFTWLGFYTKMLIPAAFFGVLIFLIPVFYRKGDWNRPSEDICDRDGIGNITMCPLCHKGCDYWKLYTSCNQAELTFFFDNPATVFFAIFMSFWATIFLELWKRKQAVVAWEWDLVGVEDEEEPRPEFEMKIKTTRLNPLTKEPEPYIPRWHKALRLFTVISCVLFMLSIVIAAVFGVIVYRIFMTKTLFLISPDDSIIGRNAKLIASLTASVMNLIVIVVLNYLYGSVATWLTELEAPRTSTDYEDSYTFKMFLFQFINYYASLIYIAFFKGKLNSHPGTAKDSITYDECDVAGCLLELCIQLAVIMVGKQALNNIQEFFLPVLVKWWRQRVWKQVLRLKKNVVNATTTTLGTSTSNQQPANGGLHNKRDDGLKTFSSPKKDEEEEEETKLTRWEADFMLTPVPRMALFDEYLEMVIQYGFVTLFVAAFPLAPFFALMNNIFELRLDAYKYVATYRRPLAKRAQDIGAWFGILQGITYVSVACNAFVIAYTSEFIPRMVYRYSNNNGSLEGYVSASLSIFNTTDFEEDKGDDDEDFCRFRGYRHPPWIVNEDGDKYVRTEEYWHIFAARLAFVVVFEHLIFLITGVLAYAIPDIPREVKVQILRENQYHKEMLLDNKVKEQDTEPPAPASPSLTVEEAVDNATNTLRVRRPSPTSSSSLRKPLRRSPPDQEPSISVIQA